MKKKILYKYSFKPQNSEFLSSYLFVNTFEQQELKPRTVAVQRLKELAILLLRPEKTERNVKTMITNCELLKKSKWLQATILRK